VRLQHAERRPLHPQLRLTCTRNRAGSLDIQGTDPNSPAKFGESRCCV
jgi:hypothetical protein